MVSLRGSGGRVWEVSIASSEALEVREAAGVRVSGLSRWGGAFWATDWEAGGPCLVGGRAAFADSAWGDGGTAIGPVDMASAGADSRCDAAPRRTTSAKFVFGVKDKVSAMRFLASLNEMFSVVLSVIISFSFFQDGHALEYAACGPSQFAHRGAESHFSETWSFEAHLAHVGRPRQLKEPWPYRWQLKHRLGLGM